MINIEKYFLKKMNLLSYSALFSWNLQQLLAFPVLIRVFCQGWLLLGTNWPLFKNEKFCLQILLFTHSRFWLNDIACPPTAAQFTYDRTSHKLDSFMGREREQIPEEREEYWEDREDEDTDSLRDSVNFQRPPLNAVDNGSKELNNSVCELFTL